MLLKHGTLTQAQLEWFADEAKKRKRNRKHKIVVLHHHPYAYQNLHPSLDASLLEESGELLANEIVKTRCKNENIAIDTLDQFVLTLGNDMYNDYYFREFGKNIDIQEQIFAQISVNSRLNNTKKTKDELKKSVIDNNSLTPTGLNFKITKDSYFSDHIQWLQKAVAFSRILIDADSLLSGITEETVFELSNLLLTNYVD